MLKLLAQAPELRRYRLLAGHNPDRFDLGARDVDVVPDDRREGRLRATFLVGLTFISPAFCPALSGLWVHGDDPCSQGVALGWHVAEETTGGALAPRSFSSGHPARYWGR